jgi:translation initiation factor IF-3
MNEAIRDREVRLIGDDGSQLGIMSAKDAYKLALEKKLDLVKIAPQAKPPVCKIMDYGKFKYEQQKRDKEAKKKQKQISLKEVRLSLKIEKHDLETKANRAIKFLEAGDKVKIALRFRGREMANTSLGYGVIDKFVEAVGEVGTLEKRPKMEGRSMVAFMVPTKTK